MCQCRTYPKWCSKLSETFAILLEIADIPIYLRTEQHSEPALENALGLVITYTTEFGDADSQRSSRNEILASLELVQIQALISV